MTTETEFGRYTDDDVAQLIDQAVEDERASALIAVVVLAVPIFAFGFLIGYITG